MTSLKHTVNILLVIFVYGIPTVWLLVTPQEPSCQKPLGMKNGDIKDRQLTSPDGGFHNGKEARKARLDGSSAYCTPALSGSSEAFYERVYMEVDLKYSRKITGFSLQGYNTYGYGKYMQLWTSDNGYYMIHKYNGSKRTPMPTFVTGETQYLPIYPAFASKLKIQLLGSSNVHCLRMEIHGCDDSKYNEYEDCKTSHQKLLEDHYDDIKFTETDALSSDKLYDAKYLPFSEANGWCLRANSPRDIGHSQNASIDLGKNFLIYGMQVNGLYYKPHELQNRMKFAPKSFRFRYGVDVKNKANLEGKDNHLSSDFKDMRNFSIPLIARYIDLSMYLDLKGNLTCIKLALYGCDAKLYAGITTNPPISPTNSTNPTTARISRYQLFDGNRYSSKINWVDVLYNGPKDSRNELREGTGCLTDQAFLSMNPDPFTKPKCWIGWKKNATAMPHIFVVLTRPVKVAGIHIRAFVNRSIGARPFKKISVTSGTRKPILLHGFLCSPDAFYEQSDGILDYYISLDDKMMQYLNLVFEYAGSWILVRQITLLKPGQLPTSTMEMTRQLIDCPVPEQLPGDEANAREVTVIVIIVLVILLMILIAFIIHHYRTNIHKVWKNHQSTNSILVRSDPHANSDRFITSDPQNGGRPYTKVQYTNNTNNTKYNKINNDDGEIYAEVGQTNSFDSGVLSDQHVSSGDCEDYRPKTYSPSNSSHNNTPNGTMLYSVPDTRTVPDAEQYAVPDIKQYAIPDAKQYAQPDSIKRDSIIYQGSNIYAPNYESPFKATVASSLYAEPNKLRKGNIKIFPRNQLVFKEKLGVGNFGEVHIAEATGLDEIYGTVGHFNSWGLPDTAKVAVKLLKSGVEAAVEKEFMKEVEVMATLKDENVVRLLGVCHEQPKLMVVEYMENGDLNQFLRDRKPDLRNCRTSQIGPNTLILDQLLHMAQQVSAGMKYLHSVGIIHRDLATRNCLVGPAYQVKIADFGMSRHMYSKEYYRVEGKAVLPIRWMAPECLYYGKFTVKTDVWSFGVTLWEIFTFARESPYANLSDTQVIEYACDLLQNPNRRFPYLKQPGCCPDDIYILMQNCWTTMPKKRPDFISLHKQLTDKCGPSGTEVSI